jgi:hypothetical protein
MGSVFSYDSSARQRDSQSRNLGSNGLSRAIGPGYHKPSALAVELSRAVGPGFKDEKLVRKKR